MTKRQSMTGWCVGAAIAASLAGCQTSSPLMASTPHAAVPLKAQDAQQMAAPTNVAPNQGAMLAAPSETIGEQEVIGAEACKGKKKEKKEKKEKKGKMDRAEEVPGGVGAEIGTQPIPSENIGAPQGVPTQPSVGAEQGVPTNLPVGAQQGVPGQMPGGIQQSVPTQPNIGVEQGVPTQLPNQMNVGTPQGIPSQAIGNNIAQPMGVPVQMPEQATSNAPVGAQGSCGGAMTAPAAGSAIPESQLTPLPQAESVTAPAAGENVAQPPATPQTPSGY